MKRKIVFLIMTMLCLTAMAQKLTAEQKAAEKARIAAVKKGLEQAKTSLKTGKDVNKAETALCKLLNDTTNRRDIRIYQMLHETVRKQYLDSNEQMFLNKLKDTTQIFSLANRLFVTAYQLDSIDAKPNVKGISAPKYRKDNALFLSKYVKNLYSGIIYYVNKQKWSDAITLADLYLELPSWGIFQEHSFAADSLRQCHAAYLMLLSGYHANDYDAALKHSVRALDFKVRKEQSLQFLATIHLSRKDTTNYLACLSEGFREYPSSAFFFPRLVDYYSERGDLNTMLQLTDTLLSVDSLNTTALVVRQSVLLNLADNDECIKLGEKILSDYEEVFATAADADYLLAEINYNTAIAYYNKAIDVAKKSVGLKARAKAKNVYYRKCLPYMERYRKLAPTERDRWKPVLYEIYLSLNMGKEFAEIEKL